MSIFDPKKTSQEPKRETEATRASLELLYHVSRELTTALDMRTVLQRVLFLSMKTVGAISGSIIVMDDNGKPIESAIITGEHIHNQTTQRLRVTLEKGLAGWVVRNRQAVLVADTNKDDRWMLRQYDEEPAGSKSAVSAPLLARERMVGVITLVHPTPNFFTPDHLSLVQAIADQAGIAVLNARLYTESQRQARVMTALAETAATITASLNLEDVLMRIMEQIRLALRTKAVSLALINSTKENLVFRAATGWENREIHMSRVNLGTSIAGWVAKEGRGAVIPDVQKDPRFDPETNQRTGLQVQAIACTPIRYRGQVIGVLEAINPTEGMFDPDALLVLTGIASLAGTAISHAQLFESLQHANQSYRELFEDSIDPIVVTDWQGGVMEVNRQALQITDYDRNTLCQMNIRQLHTIDEEKVGQSFESVSSGETLSYESLLRTHSQHVVPIQVYVRKIIVENSPHIQWILRDITEHKNLDTLREDLLSMIYHDLRSPLANVVSSLDVLDTMLPAYDNPAIKSMLNIALRSTERIQRLTNSLLDINRLEAGKPVANLQSIAPAILAQDAIDLVAPVATNKQQEIVSCVSSKLPPVMIDAEMIRRVLTNLLENAVKFTPVGGKIEVDAQQDDKMIRIWVKDTGPGIPTAEQERIFDKFTRLDPSDYPKGLGLGLAYCRLAVNAHGGRIWVESELKAGSKFIFLLPIAAE